MGKPWRRADDLNDQNMKHRAQLHHRLPDLTWCQTNRDHQFHLHWLCMTVVYMLNKTYAPSKGRNWYNPTRMLVCYIHHVRITHRIACQDWTACCCITAMILYCISVKGHRLRLDEHNVPKDIYLQLPSRAHMALVF